MSNGPSLKGRHKAQPVPQAIVPTQERETVTERTDRELAMRGTVKCALCGWSMTGRMKDLLGEQVAHRETHGVSHHPDVAKQSQSVKRSKGQAQRIKDRAAVNRLVKAIEDAGGWLDRENVDAATATAAFAAKAIAKRQRDGAWGYAVEDASPALAVQPR